MSSTPRPTPEQIVEAYDCSYHIGVAVKVLLELAQAEQSPMGHGDDASLRAAFRSIARELVRRHVWLGPEDGARQYEKDIDLHAFVQDLENCTVPERVTAIRGLLLRTVRTALEDVFGP